MILKTCWCGKKFKPKGNQVHCCPRHARIWIRATAGKFGADLIKKDPQAALRYYWYIT